MSDLIARLNAVLEGRYHIERELGEGGMATVYLARDPRHGRHVALKVLKPALAAVVGADRFLAEIETTANLQHPHILPLYDSGEADGSLYYVMPYVEGDSLRDRLHREHQLPVPDAVDIAADLADALDYAHRRGVIHRDIKPANILLQDGKPVISDFGIALALGMAGGSRLTETGLSVGTPHYMSPEQATGESSVGAATDIWALGCVLHEMLVGQPPYTGGTPQAVLGRILTEAGPSTMTDRPLVPAHVDAVVARALEKVPADRFATAAELAAGLKDPSFRHGSDDAHAASSRAGVWKPLALAFAATSAILAAVLLAEPGAGPPSDAVRRFAVPFEPGAEPREIDDEQFTVSADGTLFVYGAPDGRLWRRLVSELKGSPIPGTDGGVHPSVSPDGREVVFSQAGRVQVAAIDGSTSRTLTTGTWPRWTHDGMVYAFATEGLVRVPAAGGPSEVVVALRSNEGPYVYVDEIPEGILMLVSRGLTYDLELIRRSSGERVIMVSDLSSRAVQHLPSGHLLFVKEWTLTVDAIAPDAAGLAGRSVALMEAAPYFRLSDAGRLYYAGMVSGLWEFVWVSRSGDIEALDSAWTFEFTGPGSDNPGFDLSSDGSRVVFQRVVDGNRDIWFRELPSGEPLRLTFDEAADFAPRWDADGSSVTFVSTRGRELALWSVRLDAPGRVEQLLAEPVAEALRSADAQWLIVRTTQGGEPALASIGERDILGVRAAESDTTIALVADPNVEEREPALSPDGRWLAYSSDETGRRHVYVRPFPDVERAQVQLSVNGGAEPLWANNGRELFFLDRPNRTIVAVEFDASATFRPVRRTSIPLQDDVDMAAYDVSADDTRFLMLRTLRQPSRSLLVVENWPHELEGRLPQSRW